MERVSSFLPGVGLPAAVPPATLTPPNSPDTFAFRACQRLRRPSRVLDLTVAAFGGHRPPAIGFDQLDGLTNLWHRAS